MPAGEPPPDLNVVKFGVTDSEILLRKLRALTKEIAENWEERSARLNNAERSSLRQEIHRVTRLLEKLGRPR
jgi:hypothetical protein